jgi:hypothetical protein
MIAEYIDRALSAWAGQEVSAVRDGGSGPLPASC